MRISLERVTKSDIKKTFYQGLDTFFKKNATEVKLWVYAILIKDKIGKTQYL